jgi:hypothetical protein
MKKELLQKLQQLENEVENLRNQLCVSKRGELLFQAPQTRWSSTDVVVEADGLGGATLMVVEGNYPSDYTVHKEQRFDSEEEACKVADQSAEDPFASHSLDCT